MIKRLLGLVALLAWMPIADASLTVDGIWKAGVWATTVFADGVWQEDEDLVVVPNVVGLSASAADTALEGESLDTGTVTARCSSETLNEVLSQNPVAGTQVEMGTLVDLTTSNAVPCAVGSGRQLKIGVGLGL